MGCSYQTNAASKKNLRKDLKDKDELKSIAEQSSTVEPG